MLYLAFLLLSVSDPPTEMIVAELPQYFLDMNPSNEWSFIRLEPRPAKVNRQYFIRVVDSFGNPTENFFSVDEERFYVIAKKIVRFGVLDKSEFDIPCLNNKYENFIRLLLKYKIITEAELKTAAHYYCDRDWIESAYHLDNVVPRIISFEKWKYLAKKCGKDMPYNRYYYFTTLANIKSACSVVDLRDAMDWLNQKLSAEGPSPYFSVFLNYVKAYVELEKVGIRMDEAVRIIFLKDYFTYDSYESSDILSKLNNLQKTYSSIGLPQPDKKDINNVLNICLKTLINQNKYLDPLLIKTIRNLELEFPKEFAVDYRKILLYETGDFFEDIDYLTGIIGGEVLPKLWISSAYLNLREFKDREYRKEKHDSTDYFHIAVESFRRAGKNEINSKTINTLLNEMNDLSVRIKDIIVVYELLGKNPKLDFYVTKFNERARLYEEQDCGIYYDDSRFMWRENEYGQKIIPFRDAIELAAYLKDNKRTKELSFKILRRANWQLSQTDKSTTCAELEEILNLYESLKFTDGAYSLALHLHEAGFIEQSRRAFKIACVEKEIEKLFHSE